MIIKGDKINTISYDHAKYYKVEEIVAGRSNDQNAYLHGWVYDKIVERFDKEGKKANVVQVHELMKYLHLRKRKKCPITWRYRTVDGSTTTLSKKAFKDYIEAIEQWYYNTFNEGFPVCPYSRDLLYYDSICQTK